MALDIGENFSIAKQSCEVRPKIVSCKAEKKYDIRNRNPSRVIFGRISNANADYLKMMRPKPDDPYHKRDQATT